MAELVSDGTTKYVVINGKGECDIRFIGSDNGTMEYSVGYYDYANKKTSIIKSYQNVSLYRNKQFKSAINTEEMNELKDSAANNISLVVTDGDVNIKKVEENGNEIVLVPVITASASAGGSIDPMGKTYVTYGENQTYTIASNTEYTIKDVKVDGVSQGAINSYTFSNVTADHTIEATFKAKSSVTPTTYTITATAGIGGSITPSGATDVAKGSSQTYTIAANIGYTIADVKVDGVSQGAISTYTFSDVTASHTIEAIFKEDNPNHVNPESASLSVTSLSLWIGDVQKITYNFDPANAEATFVSVNSSAADVATATVNADNREIIVTAIKSGNSVITLTVDDCTASCSVTVFKKNNEGPVFENSPMNPVPVIDENTTEIHLVKGQKFTLSESGWICKDKRTLAVSKKNVVVARKVTTAPVQLTNGHRSIDVYITKPTMEKKSVTMQAGSVQPIGFIFDSEHLPVLYYSNAPDIATVSDEGKVTAHAKGTAMVTAFVNGSAYTCKVKVKEGIPAVDRTLHMTLKGKKTISIKGVKKVTWVSDDENIVSVTKKNKVTANATGETVLRTEYEGKEYRIRVFVEDPVITTADIQNAGKNKYKLNLKPGGSKMIEFASINQPVIFKSNKGETAYVDATGMIRTNRPGKAKLTAKVNGKTITITVTVQ